MEIKRIALGIIALFLGTIALVLHQILLIWSYAANLAGNISYLPPIDWFYWWTMTIVGLALIVSCFRSSK